MCTGISLYFMNKNVGSFVSDKADFLFVQIATLPLSTEFCTGQKAHCKCAELGFAAP